MHECIEMKSLAPYYYTHKTFAKARWIGKTLVDVFSSEFRDRTREYWTVKVSECFTVTTRKKPVRTISGKDCIGYSLQHGDLVSNVEHCHEPAITSDPINVIYREKGVVVVNKPSGIPVHPTQRYRLNTVTETLRSQLSIPKIYPCHRLDKLTSGVLILAETGEAAKLVAHEMKKSCQKYYVARVCGEFPAGETVCRYDIVNVESKRGFENGVSTAKPAETQFTLWKYNRLVNESIVLCKPLSGRTHQIRIHLARLGHPIKNDTLYNAKGVLRNFLRSGHVGVEEFQEIEKRAAEKRQSMVSSTCQECKGTVYADPSVEELHLWLCSYKYELDGETFEVEFPKWCDI